MRKIFAKLSKKSEERKATKERKALEVKEALKKDGAGEMEKVAVQVIETGSEVCTIALVVTFTGIALYWGARGVRKLISKK